MRDYAHGGEVTHVPQGTIPPACRRRAVHTVAGIHPAGDQAMTAPPEPAVPGVVDWANLAGSQQARFRRGVHWLVWLAARHAARQGRWRLPARGWLAVITMAVTAAVLLAVADAVRAGPVRGAGAALFGILVAYAALRYSRLAGEARVDGKTGLLNASAWQRQASAEIARAARAGAPLAVAIADADHFKAVNDTHGHLAGDQVLAVIAAKLGQALRSCDVIGRFGGEEFAMVLPATTLQEARQVIERLRRSVAAAAIPARDGGPPLRVTVSVGVAALSASRRDLAGLLESADAALYAAKSAGRNRVRMAGDTGTAPCTPRPGRPAPAAGEAGAGDPRPAGPGPGGPPVPGDATMAHPARIWNYWLGGSGYYDVDRAAADQYASAFPQITGIARHSRYFLVRVVRYLAAEAGVRQFIDVGPGLPATENTHEVADRIAPGCKTVYVDNDPLVLAHARAGLAGTPEDACAYVGADLRDPAAVLAAAAGTLDLDQPVAILLMGVLGHVRNDAEAAAVARHLVNALPPGGFLALYDSIGTGRDCAEAARGYAATGAVPYRLRSARQIMSFLTGLDLVQPGLVPITCWRPDSSPFRPHELPAFGAVGKKPR